MLDVQHSGIEPHQLLQSASASDLPPEVFEQAFPQQATPRTQALVPVKNTLLKASESRALDAMRSTVGRKSGSGGGGDEAVLLDHLQAARCLACDR